VEELLISMASSPTSTSADLSSEPASRSTGVLTPARVRIGELLVNAKLVTEKQIDEALQKQATWGSRLGDIILAMGWVKPLDFYRVLAQHFGLEFVNLIDHPADERLFEPGEYSDYAQHLYLPWQRREGVLWIATAEPGSQHLRHRWVDQSKVKFVVTSKFDIVWELQRVAGPAFSQQALFELVRTDPEHSASVVMPRSQKHAAVAILLFLLLSFLVFPLRTTVLINLVLNVLLCLSFVFRTILCWISCGRDVGMSISEEQVASLQDADLPIYTVLVPMYKEPDVLPILAAALRRMDYPRSKLDIKLVLENNDHETIAAAKALALDATFEIIRVPHSEPKTKPKACNYALRFARGKYLTIYDAEDKPEPDQLKKVVAGFRRLGERAACIQARLNYFNSEENWLTRMFTLEYSLWFDMFLPALDRLNVPIPLGGTSNHFEIEKLREVGAWDPFNVTEDADLGLRFAALGYHVGVVNSVTYEEANSRVGNWIRQRSRWVKGYIQTWLVNMRHPIRLFRKVGFRGFCSLQLFVGGSIVSGLAYPFLLFPFLIWICTGTTSFHRFFPPEVLLVSVLNLAVGNSCLIYVSMLAVAKRKHYELLPYAITTPIYWLLQSIASYKALWQLITKPFYWEKTVHGISKFTNSEILRANANS
jgi:cellulose synthase/poly-beta-1,6-N-acetylglucosamine synthase-like glycosyltransferase